MITKFRVQNYKALRDVTLDLTPIHVLIGPNDAGKTSLLEAMGALCRSVDMPLADAFQGEWSGRELVWKGGKDDDGAIALMAQVDEVGLRYELRCRFAAANETGGAVRALHESITGRGGESKYSGESGGERGNTFLRNKKSASLRIAVMTEAIEASGALIRELSGVQSHRWIPSMLSIPTAPYERDQFTIETTGFGLALCLDDFLSVRRQKFDQIEEQLRGIFPEIASITLPQAPAYRVVKTLRVGVPVLEPAIGKQIKFELRNGTVIPAAQMSDGVLLVLAYLAILKSPNPPRLLLIEEPENGVHPKRLSEVLSILRTLVKEQSHTQIVMTTHSPYVLDEFKPEEVTICTKGADGAVSTRRLSESKTVREQLDVFTLGEIWTAEGDEALANTKDRHEDSTT
jgi:predicted ATPase